MGKGKGKAESGDGKVNNNNDNNKWHHEAVAGTDETGPAADVLDIAAAKRPTVRPSKLKGHNYSRAGTNRGP